MKIFAALATLMIVGAVSVYSQDPPPAPQGTPGHEGTKTPKIHERQKHQHNRIKEGVKSGELTKGEARKLHSEEKTINAEKQMAKEDGKVTPAERAKLRKDQNKASKDIYRLKHNDKTKQNPPGEAK